MAVTGTDEMASPTKFKEYQDEGISTRGLTEMNKIGKYQIIVYIAVSLPLALSAGFTLGYAFTSGEVDYRCLIPECENSSTANWSSIWAANSKPKSDSSFGSCERFQVNDNVVGECSKDSFGERVVKCDSWVYDPLEKTILSEWNFTCNENRWKLAMVGTVNNIGQLVGLMFAGYLSDRYGRRTCLVVETFTSGIFGLIQSFSVNYWMFMSMEFLMSVAAAGIYSSGFILGMEMVGGKKRVLGATFIGGMYAVGEMYLGAVAMFLKSWRPLLRAIFAPGLLAIFLPFIVPESIAWLAAKGKHSEVEKVYKRMAKMNGLENTQIPLSIYEELNATNTEKKPEIKSSSVPVREALSRPKLLIRLLACCLCWLTNTFVYYGMSLNAVAFAGDKYVNFILVSLVEIPAYFLSWLLIDYVGRKPTLSGSFLFSGIFCLAIQFVPKDSWSYAPLLLYMGGKGCITMAFAAVYVYTTEMFPTTARHFLLSICSMTGRIGSILAPQTRLLATVVASLPLILFGTMGILAGVVSLVFPETLGIKLPDTVTEAENIGKPKRTKDKNIT
ncbi:solute carrier family 22 member 21 [Fopius arisanus]|uniref:Solute carrier family 22 member 21 n=2 Tax=Fopius arisanus TaxID=64838 RepID=A0A9R1SUK4_9HYME|nr:PREDICTED: solute carrier family 22 member 21-like [Fopius arisanus]XP_011297430.1 PREDICTED: solute carrier family 22 member 21-like [Fopius arisanus]XP_011297441.1 PREDICTED: solute carrier family 22 member 21-like [Fopius arisanus]XP_011297450.1 PREDICTED: solute carrier family 22 member 21-like [Fopius arisanus]